MFKGRSIVIATKHQKEEVIAPILKKELGVKCIVPKNFDTDIYGTFTGEIERTKSPLETARQKCLAAMKITGCDIAISSEGSFGAHPTIFFAQADIEVILFMDKKNDLEIFANEVSTKTNFNGNKITSYNELLGFATSAKFPTHALILRNKKDSNKEVFKGITEQQDLKKHYNYLSNKYGKVYVETDMRAMYNPTRMKVIMQAMLNLLQKIKSVCPKCNTPGFSVSKALPGLPCSECSMKTRSTLAHIYSCSKCNYVEEKQHPHGKLTEEPTFCDFCNP